MQSPEAYPPRDCDEVGHALIRVIGSKMLTFSLLLDVLILLLFLVATSDQVLCPGQWQHFMPAPDPLPTQVCLLSKFTQVVQELVLVIGDALTIERLHDLLLDSLSDLARCQKVSIGPDTPYGPPAKKIPVMLVTSNRRRCLGKKMPGTMPLPEQ